MTPTCHRLYVVHTPSPLEFSWRYVFAAAALQAGWTTIDDAGQSPDDQPVIGNLLIQSSDPVRAGIWNPTEVMVVVDTPNNAIDATLTQSGIELGDAVRYVSHRLAALAALVEERPTTVACATALVITLPQLGEVRLPELPVSAADLPGPLAIYEHLPPRKGSRALWPQSLFIINPKDHGDSVDGLEVDLTGRRRVLQHGPYIILTPGVWEITVQFAVGVNSTAIDLRFEWGTGADADVVSHSIKTSGLYEVVLSKTWAETAPVELRIWLDRAIFDGGFELKLCSVQFLGAEEELQLDDQVRAATSRTR